MRRRGGSAADRAAARTRGAGARRPAVAALSLVFACCALLALAAPAAGVQEFASNPTHRGVVDYQPYQLFPENRPGNAVYFQNKLLLSLAGVTIRHVLPMPKPGRFAYLAVNAEGASRIGVFLQPQDKQIRLTDLGHGFFHTIVSMDGVVYKKLFRILEGSTIVDLLPASKTADGAVAGERGVVFYHVSAAIDADPATGTTEKRFGLQLHLALYDEEQVRHYEFQIFNSLPQLTLAWADPEHITYKLEDGRSEVLSVSQFQ